MNIRSVLDDSNAVKAVLAFHSLGLLLGNAGVGSFCPWIVCSQKFEMPCSDSVFFPRHMDGLPALTLFRRYNPERSDAEAIERKKRKLMEERLQRKIDENGATLTL